MSYCNKSYVCVPRFRFRSKSLLFTPNPGHYTPKSTCSSPNGLLFTQKFSSCYLPVSVVLSICPGGWEFLHVQIMLLKTSGRGGFECVRLRRCEQNYFSAIKFNFLIPITNLTPSLYHGSIMDLVPELRGSSGSTTSQPKFQSIR